MFKIFILLSAAAVFASAASIKSTRITPEQLELIWETIERDIRSRQEETEQEIRNIIEPAKILIDAAKESLVHEVEQANEMFHQEVEHVEQEAHSDREVERCVEEANEELKHVDDEIFEHHAQALDELQHKAEEAIDAAIKITTDALEEIDEFRRRVEECHEERCADELHVELVEVYERIVKEVDQTLERATEEILIALPTDLEREHLNHLDIEQYQQVLHELIEKLQECARV